MMAEVGLRLNVTGMRRAIPAIGPSPGKDADQGSRDGAEQAIQQIGHRGGDPKTGDEMLDGFDHFTTASYRPINPLGRGILRNQTNRK